MIRPALPADQADLLALLKAIELFPPKELAEVSGLLVDWLKAGHDSERMWLVDVDEAPRGIAYVVPEVQTDRTWNLLLIAMHPGVRGGGRGGALLQAVERQVAARGGRMLIVETSGTGGFERTRAFYRGHGYDEEGRIRDFYTTGDDKVVFRKLLSA
jgi:ribosomal protein S18 acetylase RimI-like enzyme